MHAIVGLGNPGEEYALSRHNLGFLLVDELMRRHRRRGLERSGLSVVDRFSFAGEEVLLVKPTCYMNRSGRALAEISERHDLTPGRILVGHDDLDLELGRVMVKRSGGTAGHRGLESIVRALGTDRFARVRMGVGRPHPDVDPVDWVLEEFRRSERKDVEEMVIRAAEAAESYVRDGLETAMNRHNRWPV